MKDSFILYTEQKAIIDKLSNEQAGKLIKAIYEYVETDKMPSLDNIVDLAITPFKLALDRNKEKYEKVSRIRAEAGAKGGKQKKQMKTKESKCNDNENVNVNDNVNENNNDNVSDSCVDGLQEVIDFYNNNIGMITEYGLEVFSDYTKELGKELVIYAMQISVEANKRTIQYIKAILNNWKKAGIKTLVEAKEENSKPRNTSAEEEFLNAN